ncbi:MAG: hypothetical protein K0R45_1555 [Pseudomonas sp.]|jgi:uncharacterized protein YjiS (DUF1127 family)|nr:hypothetical protein [Pseudomonas sp.]
MNGLTDVRLMLLGRELEQENDRANALDRIAPHKSVPAGMGRWALYRHRAKSRRALLELTDAQLRDIGLDFREARIEAMKPFWRD